MRGTPEVQADNDETTLRPYDTENQYGLPLPPHPIAAEQARILMRIALTAWNISDIIDNALIVTAELVTNAACAVRRSVLSPVQPGGTEGMFLGLMAYPDP